MSKADTPRPVFLAGERDGYFCHHRFEDFVMLSILEDEYRARYGK